MAKANVMGWFHQWSPILESQGWTDSRPVDRFVASGRPAGALLHAHSVIGTANEEPAATDLLHVAFEAEIRVALSQQLGINRAMDRVTGGAAFAHGFMLKDRRTTLSWVAAEAHVIQREQGSAAAGVNGVFVRRMAIGAAHFALWNRMMVGEAELGAHIGMALETDGILGARRFHSQPGAVTAGLGPTAGERIRRFHLATGIRMQAGRAVTGFAPGIEGIGPLGNQARMIGSGKVSIDFFVTLFAFFRADVFCAGDIRQHHHSAMDCPARHGCQEKNHCCGRQKLT